MQSGREFENKDATIAEIRAERRSALALVRLLLYAAVEADELGLPECQALVMRAAEDVTSEFGLSEPEIMALPT